jgi:iron-sulfur cluster assembly protein
MTKAPIDISSEALISFKALFDKRTSEPQFDQRVVRLGVRGGGCSGFSYIIDLDQEQRAIGDVVWCLDGITFRVDKKSLKYLAGSRLLWKATLLYSGFEFDNPNEVSKCGCGHSFYV